MKKCILLAFFTSFFLMNCNQSPTSTSESQSPVSPTPNELQAVKKHHSFGSQYVFATSKYNGYSYRWDGEWRQDGWQKLDRISSTWTGGAVKYGVYQGKIYWEDGSTNWSLFPNQIPSNGQAVDISDAYSSSLTYGHLLAVVSAAGHVFYTLPEGFSSTQPAWKVINKPNGTAISNVSRVDVDGNNLCVWVIYKSPGNTRAVTKCTYNPSSQNWAQTTTYLPSGLATKNIGVQYDWYYNMWGAYVTTTTNKLYWLHPWEGWKVFPTTLPSDGTAVSVDANESGEPIIGNSLGEVWFCDSWQGGGGTWVQRPGISVGDVSSACG